MSAAESDTGPAPIGRSAFLKQEVEIRTISALSWSAEERHVCSRWQMNTTIDRIVDSSSLSTLVSTSSSRR